MNKTEIVKPWLSEPEMRRGMHKSLPFVILRNKPTGTLCGYVATPTISPFYGKDYCDVQAPVHGGFTYSDPQLPYHDLAPRTKGYWWFGFDCAHHGDLMPTLPPHEGAVYRDMAFVEAECRKAIEFLLGAKPIESKDASLEPEGKEKIMKPHDYDEALDQIAEENQRLIKAIKRIAKSWDDPRAPLARAVRDAVALVDELQKEKS